MNTDKFQTCWQLQDWRINPDNLAASMQQLDRSFSRTIFWRDAREIVVALVLIPVWIWLGFTTSSAWTWYLEIPALMWIAGFMLVDHMRQRRAAPAAGASLRAGMESSLAQVEHQIWLLRNILVWYLLPMAIPMFLFSGQLAGRSGGFSWESIPVTLGPVATVVGVFGFVYWLNQWAVRKQLEPLRERLQAALLELKDDEPAAGG